MTWWNFHRLLLLLYILFCTISKSITWLDVHFKTSESDQRDQDPLAQPRQPTKNEMFQWQPYWIQTNNKRNEKLLAVMQNTDSLPWTSFPCNYESTITLIFNKIFINQVKLYTTISTKITFIKRDQKYTSLSIRENFYIWRLWNGLILW